VKWRDSGRRALARPDNVQRRKHGDERLRRREREREKKKKKKKKEKNDKVWYRDARHCKQQTAVQSCGFCLRIVLMYGLWQTVE